MASYLSKKAVDILIGAAIPAAVKLGEKAINEKIDGSGNDIRIPELYGKGVTVNAEDAKVLLESLGLKVMLRPMTVEESKESYKDCIDQQVMLTRPKSGSSVKPESAIIVKYITQEVIDKSQLIFEEQQASKAARAEEKAVARKEQISKIKDSVSGAVEKSMQGLMRLKRGGTTKQIENK